MWSSFRAVFYKEWLHIRRDRMTLIFTLMMPMIQMMVYGWMDTNVRHIPTVVCDESRSVESRRFLDELRATGSFDLSWVPTPGAARAAVVSARAKVAVTIPPDFHDKILRNENAQVLVLVDGSESTVAATAVSATSGVALSESVRRLSTRVGPRVGQLEARPVVLFNPDSRTANYLIPGLVAVLLQMITSVLTAIAIVRERERGTLEQLLVTPVETVGLMLGKIAPYLVVGFAELTGILAVMHFVFEVPIHGNLVFLYAMALVYVFALLSIGLYVSIGAQTQQQAQGTIQMFFLPSMFLSGYIFPLASLPWPLRILGQVFPVTHFIEIMRGVVLRGAGPLELWRSCAALFVISTALIAASVRRFRKMSLV
jgi:ABC-2 type transport system permease protein